MVDGDIFRIIVPLDDMYSYDAGTGKAQLKRKIKRNDENCALTEDLILDYLATHPKATQIEIAEAVGKSRRTIQSIVAVLRKWQIRP